MSNLVPFYLLFPRAPFPFFCNLYFSLHFLLYPLFSFSSSFSPLPSSLPSCRDKGVLTRTAMSDPDHPTRHSALALVHQCPLSFIGSTLLSAAMGPALDMGLFSSGASQSRECLCRRSSPLYHSSPTTQIPLGPPLAQVHTILQIGESLVSHFSSPPPATPSPKLQPLVMSSALPPHRHRSRVGRGGHGLLNTVNLPYPLLIATPYVVCMC